MREDIVEALDLLSSKLFYLLDNQNNSLVSSDVEVEKFRLILEKAQEQNPWFDIENIRSTIFHWANSLKGENLKRWLKPYVFAPGGKRVLIVTAGNIPLVGFHDFLCTIVSNNCAIVKMSSSDSVLLPYLSSLLCSFLPSLSPAITFTDGKAPNFDAVIATGSNNTARYFDYYFSSYPHLIRKSRTSVAVLSGDETKEQLDGLARDILCHYGLGCRNVTKIFIPRGYCLDNIFGAIYPYNHIMENTKYANNYEYNKAVYLMSLFDFKDNGFFMLKEDFAYKSPISCAFYQYYDSVEALRERLLSDAHQIQCIVSCGFTSGEVAFGQAQNPDLWDYADNIDTLEFLCNL